MKTVKSLDDNVGQMCIRDRARPVASSGAGRKTRSEGVSISNGWGAFWAAKGKDADKKLSLIHI